MTTAAIPSARPAGVDRSSGPSVSDAMVRVGRVALVTQGLLYLVVGLLAARVASGDHAAKPSQHGAIASVARQPFGRVLLVLLALALAAHAIWRLALAVRGEPGPDDDGGSLAKRAGNLGRAVIYGGFFAAAVKVLVGTGENGGGKAQKKSTAVVLGWPGGRYLVMAAGVAVIGSALWNLRKGATRSFRDNLDLHELDEKQRHAVDVVGTIGYLARGVAFGLVGWFLLRAGLDSNAHETRGLDGSLKSLVAAPYGPWLLFVLAVGLVLFGAFRVLDGVYRKRAEITYA